MNEVIVRYGKDATESTRHKLATHFISSWRRRAFLLSII